MKWQKKGLVYCPAQEFNWMKDRAIAPVPHLISPETLRIYFSTRDQQGRSTPIYLDTKPGQPELIQQVHGTPVLPFGAPGSFDDNGILISSILQQGNDTYLYYVGWNPRVTVPYHLSIGLAISHAGGPFEKYSTGPILDRGPTEPYFNTAPCVLHQNGRWHMWYVSCTGWKQVHGQAEPLYNVKYAASTDGLYWERTGQVAIANDDFAEAIGKPFVYHEAGRYKMIYAYRNSIDYRTNPQTSYRLGYAESDDGQQWQRLDDQVGISFSPEGWDSLMMEYASSYTFNGKRYLLYNGNGFGESGFGYAVQETP